MSVPAWIEQFDRRTFEAEAASLLGLLRHASSLDAARRRLYAQVSDGQLERYSGNGQAEEQALHVARDCARVFRSLLHPRSEQLVGFSVCEALRDIAWGRERRDLGYGFYAELIHLVRGLQGRAPAAAPLQAQQPPELHGRAAALLRSRELDDLWAGVERTMGRYEDGLVDEALRRRTARRRSIVGALGATEEDFGDWRWQIAHIARDAATLERLVPLQQQEREAILAARAGRLPFGVTPYYASLLDDEPSGGRDRALRAQVIPSPGYVARLAAGRGQPSCGSDFMRETDTSPVDLVTRRYPAIAILKPFNTCPQICVYCQRNWEIDEAMAGGALATPEALDRAIHFLQEHQAIREVLVTGGDPLGLADEQLLPILERVAAIPHVELLRIGTRTPVTLPMRITPALAAALGGLRIPGRKEVCVVTHVEHPYEVTPELVQAVDRLRRQGISVYNQLVYTFFVSRRFEAVKLRMLLRRCGVEPYYTFLPKGKEETRDYRVPLARLLQEQKEEARLLPGSRRTDEAVYNVPGLGKNYLRAFQHRDLIGISPEGARTYEFHPWEKGIASRSSYVGRDVPVLEYLHRLAGIGEDVRQYESIWYYF